jgi:putative ABC transport system permease protein
VKASEHARTAWSEIRAHKARSAMTCLSLAVGVAALLFTFSQTAGVMRSFRETRRLAGPGRLLATQKQNYVSKGISPGLAGADARAIRAQWPELYMVYPKATLWGVRVKLPGFSNENIRVLATTDEWRKRDWVYQLRGRFFEKRDLDSGARVCVMVEDGGWIRKPFWAAYVQEEPLSAYMRRHDALGQEALINGHLFRVIGLLKQPPNDRDPRWFREGGGEGLVLVPLTAFENTMANDSRGRDAVGELDIDTGDEETAGIYTRRVAALLRSRHREDDVDIRDYRDIMEGAVRQIRRFILSILVIGIVAVLASGIGIMNVTLATIFSRVREIGIRRALGARRVDIAAQFVAEAMALGLAGGVAGTALGIAGVLIEARKDLKPPELDALQILASLAIALATGFFFSLYPAWKASRFDPIEALRYE